MIWHFNDEAGHLPVNTKAYLVTSSDIYFLIYMNFFGVGVMITRFDEIQQILRQKATSPLRNCVTCMIKSEPLKLPWGSGYFISSDSLN